MESAVDHPAGLDGLEAAYETIAASYDGGIWSVQLNRPSRMNALNERMYDELTDVIGRVVLDRAARVLVISGSAGAFCAGVDLGGSARDEATVAVVRRHGRLAKLLHDLVIPSIAAVDGPAVGAGCNLALGCDFVLSSERGSFAQVFAHRGMGLDWGGSWLLPRLVGLRRATELALLGERITAAQAEELGLINRVTSSEELSRAVDELAGRLASMAPLALSTIKEELRASIAPSFSTAIQIEAYGQCALRATSDAHEGFSSFLEKRTPKFRGR